MRMNVGRGSSISRKKGKVFPLEKRGKKITKNGQGPL